MNLLYWLEDKIMPPEDEFERIRRKFRRKIDGAETAGEIEVELNKSTQEFLEKESGKITQWHSPKNK